MQDIQYGTNKGLTSSMIIKSYVSYNKKVKRSRILKLHPFIKTDNTAVKIMKIINKYCERAKINLDEEGSFIDCMHPSTVWETALNLSKEPDFKPNEYAEKVLLKEYFPGLKPLPDLLSKLWRDIQFQELINNLERISQEKLGYTKKDISSTVNEMCNFLGLSLIPITVYLLPSYTYNGNATRYKINNRYQMCYGITPAVPKYMLHMITTHETIHCCINKIFENLSDEKIDITYNGLLVNSSVKKNWTGSKVTYIDEILTRLFTAYCINKIHNNNSGDKCIEWDEKRNGYTGLKKLWERFITIKSSFYGTLLLDKERFLSELITYKMR